LSALDEQKTKELSSKSDDKVKMVSSVGLSTISIRYIGWNYHVQNNQIKINK